MAEPIKITFTLTKDEVKHGYRSIIWASNGFRVIIAVLIVALLAGLGTGVFDLLIIFFGGALVLAIWTFYTPVKIWNRSQALRNEQSIEISADGFKQSTVLASSDLKWSAFKGWRENKEMFFLRLSQVAIIVPKRALNAEQQEGVQGFLQTAHFE